MRGGVRSFYGVVGVVVVCGCAAQQGMMAGETQLAAGTLRDVSGNTVGTARIIRAVDNEVRLRLDVTGLPAGTHGAHLHTVGACDASGQTAFASAGGHFNPAGRQHGRQNPAGPHAGDLPNITVDANGRGQLEVPLANALVAGGAGSLFDDDGSAVVVHANADDEVTDSGPAGPGNSGSRIACGVITRS